MRHPLAVLMLLATAGSASAQPMPMSTLVPPPQNVLALTAQATAEVPQDLLMITLSVTRDGSEAGAGARPEVIIAHHDTVVQTNDHVIVFVPRKRMVREVEKLFQVSATFLF